MPNTGIKRGSVLIIEDEEHFRTYLENIVKKDYHCFSAGSWSEARSLLFENSIDIVLIDLRLPGVSGKRIAWNLLTAFPYELILFIITGFEHEWDRTDALEHGIASYFIKGKFNPDDLLRHMNEATARKVEKRYTELSSSMLLKLYKFTNKLISLDSLNDVLDAVIEMLQSVTGCLRISIMLLSADSKYLYIKRAIGLDKEIVRSTKLKVGENVAGKAFSERQVITSDLTRINRSLFSYSEKDPFMSIPLLEVPHRKGKKPIGVINLTNKSWGEGFSENEKRLLTYIANSASIAIKSELRNEALEKNAIDTLILLINVIEARDKYTRGHSIRVGEYAAEIARRFGFNDYEVKEILYAGQLHDIGKIEIPDSILLKKAKLTENEYKVIKRHPITSKRIVDHLSYFHSIKGLFLHHHERYDGNGYPDGIGDDNIEIGARILAVADAYDAMTSDRPYRNAMTHQQACEILRQERGKQFDPRCVDVFLEYINSSL
jgi:HD-GYP domain-containing protein (c-di-GMP phosphodiesterase class II)/DNA-binding NarL/FixJ family response regulator